MVKIKVTVKKKGDIEAIIKRIGSESIDETMQQSNKIIEDAINLLEKEVKTTPGWLYAISQEGIGELGFANHSTPFNLLDVLRSDSIKNSGRTQGFISRIFRRSRFNGLKFQWGFIDSMLNNEMLTHTLDKVGGRSFELGPRVNWFSWIEKGVSIAGFLVTTDINRLRYSRSGLATMQEGGSFAISPMRFVEATARSNIKKIENLFKNKMTTILQNKLIQKSKGP